MFFWVVIIAIGTAVGSLLGAWLKTVPHKLRVRRFEQTLKLSNDTDLVKLALEGYDEIFSMVNRNCLIELSFCKDAQRRTALTRMIAEDVAERWHKVSLGKRAVMPSLMKESDLAQIEEAKAKVLELAESVELLERLQTSRETSQTSR